MYEHIYIYIYIYIYVSVLLVLSHVLPQVHLVMAPKAAFTVERLNGFGAAAVEAALTSLSQESAAALEHLSCQYSFSNLVCKF
jgi:hypothetical protein